MSAINGQVWSTGSSINIDLQNGAITSIPVIITGYTAGSGTLTITLSNVAQGVLFQLTVWNQGGTTVPLAIAAVDIGENIVPVGLISNGALVNFNKHTANIPAGSINSAIGSMWLNTNGQEEVILRLE